MSEQSKYNGWTNYETWVVKLWIDNEQNSSEYWNDTAREIFKAAVEVHESWNTPSEQARFNLADRLKEQISDPPDDAPSVFLPHYQNSMYSDLLNAALSDVNWHEIAGAFLDDCEAENDEGDTVKYGEAE